MAAFDGLRSMFAGRKAQTIGLIDTAQNVNDVIGKIKRGQAGDPPKRGVEGILASYESMPWVRACAGRVSSSMSAVQWRLYATKKPGEARAYRHRLAQTADVTRRKHVLQSLRDSSELTELSDHPFLDLMTKGNGYHTGVALRRIESLHMDLVGEAFLYKGRNMLGVTVALWPIPPTWIMSTPTPAFPFFRVSYRTWQENLPAADVLWMCDPGARDPYGRGVGLGHAIADEAEIDEFAAKTSRQLFFNRAQPDFLVYPKGERAELDETETKRFEQSWLNKLQGYWRSSKPHFLSREVGVYEFQKNIKDLMLTEIRLQERDIILQVWGMPPEKLGILNNSNRATIDGSDLIYSKELLVPRLEMRRSFYQEMLIPEYDDRLIVAYDTPVTEDREFALKAAQAAPYVLDANEWRGIMGYHEQEEFNHVLFVPPSITAVKLHDLIPEPMVDPGADPSMPMPEEIDGPILDADGEPLDPEAEAVEEIISPIDDDGMVTVTTHKRRKPSRAQREAEAAELADQT